MKKLKIAVGMSGGVDSSLVASLLVEAGHEVVGVYLDCWGEPGCGIDENRKDAMRVGLKLGIKMKVLDFKKEYKKKVMDWFFEEVKKGRTPNPDVLCNKEIKFGMFLEWAMKEGFEKVATGHYARLGKVVKEAVFSGSSTNSSPSRSGLKGVPSRTDLINKKINCVSLLQAKDKHKDQTYFLAMVERSKFDRVLFPIGGMLKSEVRREAKKRGIHVWNKKSTSGICFIGRTISFEDLLKTRIKKHEGEVEDLKGEVIGKHKGVEFYTIGQRHGFEVRVKTDKSKPLFVVSKDKGKNRLVVGEKEDLMRDSFEVAPRPRGKVCKDPAFAGQGRLKNSTNDIHHSAIDISHKTLLVRIRHGGELVRCVIKGNKVKLSKKVFGVALGQVAVLYQKMEGSVPSIIECLEGGVII